MTRHLIFAASLLLGVAFSCNGELDAFTEHDPNTTGGTATGGRGGTATGGTATGGRGGTATGGTATGGRGGTGGSLGGEGGDTGGPDMLLIDDFEDGDRFALVQNAEWQLLNNGTGVQNLSIEMPPVGRPDSSYSLHTSGVGFEGSGAGLVLDIGGDASSFDASGYAALTFEARAEAGTTPEVLLTFLVGSEHFAVPVRLDTTWGPHTIPFSVAIPVENPGSTFDPSALAAIQIATDVEISFDFWLDDLAFVK